MIDKDRNIINDLHYIFSFVYKKDDKLVLDALYVLRALIRGPQKGSIAVFLIMVGQESFTQILHLANSQNAESKIKQVCIEIILGITVYVKTNLGSQESIKLREVFVKLLKKTNFISLTCLNRILKKSLVDEVTVSSSLNINKIQTASLTLCTMAEIIETCS